MPDASEDERLEHCARLARRIPLVGFYLQPAVGGVVLGPTFWRRLTALDNVVAIKIAPFNRYRTLDVVRGVVEAGAEDRVTLYTGNDDHILLDLVTPYRLMRGGEAVTVRIKGGLLGHWSVWVKRAVELLDRAHAAVDAGAIDPDFLALDAQITDCNAALFDVANDFQGLHRGLPRGAAPAGAVARHLVPRPGGGAEPRPGGRDRPCLRGLPRTHRR